MPRVAVFGGGPAGLATAHELCERGFEVTLYERSHWGGKLRTIDVPHTGTGQRRDLPVEHGFHFFPTFYRHVPDTMRRIPLPDGSGTVFDRLVQGHYEVSLRTDRRPMVMPSRFEPSPGWLSSLVRGVRSAMQGIPTRELQFFLGRQLEFMTACEDRRIDEYDEVSWWDWTESERMSPAYRSLIGRMPPLNLIAVPPKQASSRTMGMAATNMMMAGFLPGNNIDRCLDDDASAAWVDPWLRHLDNAGVTRVFHATLEQLEVAPDRQRIDAARVSIDGTSKKVVADYYVAALPVEVMCRLLTPPLLAAAPSLASIRRLNARWMNGLSIFLRRPFPVIRGHIAYEQSAWGLTSVSQAQFWKNMAGMGTGDVRDVFSVIISDWRTPGTEVVEKPAAQCTRDEIRAETLAQLNAGLRTMGHEILRPKDILHVYIDPDIRLPRPVPGESGKDAPLPTAAAFAESESLHNAEPLFASTVGAWRSRPNATTELRNLFIASDYVATYMDFASAEGANQAGRMAANGIIAASGSSAPPARLWPNVEPLEWLRWIDQWRFDRGLPQLSIPLPGMRRRRPHRRRLPRPRR